jgi:hypothetical protein
VHFGFAKWSNLDSAADFFGSMGWFSLSSLCTLVQNSGSIARLLRISSRTENYSPIPERIIWIRGMYETISQSS